MFNKKIDLSTYPRYLFLKTADVELYNEDTNEIIEKYSNEKNMHIFRSAIHCKL
jgi:hypothetical protein